MRAANNLGDDVRKVSRTAAPIVESAAVPQQPQQPASIIAGTIGKSRLVDRLVKQKKIDVKKVRGQWESYLIDVVDVLTPYHRITVTSAICEMRKTKGIILYI
ncbi:MAG: hypothetical protein IKH01_01240 [Prevotella sp.]|nr:hypothetical protein [Prevotella sp.]